MTKRAKFALLVVLTLALVIGLFGTALAVPPAGGWTDLSYSDVGPYGITLEQVGMISDGYTDGSWKPYVNMSRAHFVKMAVDAYKIPLVNPATPTYTDVSASHPQYQWIEAATAAGLTNGVGGGLFKPEDTITREQAAAIIVRWVAQKNGYDLATMYTDGSAAAILAEFPDGATVSASLQKEIAFAVQMGIMWGTNEGKLAPEKTLLRLQGAAMIIRSWAIVPAEEPAMPPAAIDVTAGDGAENLIGQTHTITFKVVDANGDPVEGALVDFDTLTDPWYVGNIQPEAALTDADGEVMVNVISTEIGYQRISATVRGEGALYTAYATKYWVALDEVYFVNYDTDRGLWSQNNAGTTHTWEARVVVFGPGPWSTSRQDFYNAVADDAAGTADPNEGIAWEINTYADELDMADAGYLPRVLADVPVEWNIVDYVGDPDDEDDDIVSVGDIVDAYADGVVAADGMSATAVTDDEGLTSVDIYSEEIGETFVTVVADYPENPYPGLLVNRDIYINDGFDFSWWLEHWNAWVDLDIGDGDIDAWLDYLSVGAYWWWDEDYWTVEDWEPQPNEAAVKSWIAHDPNPQDGPIDPAFTEANIGEELTLTLTLVDEFGNPVAGREVEWFMQGIGFFQTDDSGDTSDFNSAAGNKDFDKTNSAGKATVFIKSYTAGEQIVHAKVRGKGTGGAEGTYNTYTAEVQWFDVDVATFDNPATTDENEALDSNPVGTCHTFDMWVYGLKLEYAPTIDEPDGQTAWVDTDAAGYAYDGVIDWRDAEYLGGILLVNYYDAYYDWSQVMLDDDDDGNGDGVISADEAGYRKVTVAGRELTLSLVGGYTMYDWDDDGIAEPFEGRTGIYLPLEGKTVTFTQPNEAGADLSNTGAMFDGEDIASVGTFSPATDVTDADGMVSVEVCSNLKGPQTIKGTVDWAGNPHNGPELLSAYAKKLWKAGADDITIEVWIDGKLVATSVDGEIADGWAPAWTWNEDGAAELNSANVEVHVKDAYGNDLPDYEVVYLLESIDTWMPGKAWQSDGTFIPWAYLADLDTDNDGYDQNDSRPDADEPTPESDPYATIVGDGGTAAFFFNQWLGSEKPVDYGQPGLREWWKRIAYMGFDGYYADMLAAEYTYDWPSGWWADDIFDGFDGVLDGWYDYSDVGLATDGAKAWTLDGFYDDGYVVNELTGSNVDIKLADARPWWYFNEGLTPEHVKSILRVMVYAPADGLVKEGTPIWSTQVHQVWEAPVPTTITLTPETAINEYEGYHTLSAVVLDQFGDPVPGVWVDFYATQTEGDGALYDYDGFEYDPDDPFGAETDEDGLAQVIVYDDSWGHYEFTAVVDSVESNTVDKYWAYSLYDLDDAYFEWSDGYNDLYLPDLGDCNNNLPYKVHLNGPAGTVVANGTYDAGGVNVAQTSVSLAEDDVLWIEFVGADLDDNCPNWVYGPWYAD